MPKKIIAVALKNLSGSSSSSIDSSSHPADSAYSSDGSDSPQSPAKRSTASSRASLPILESIIGQLERPACAEDRLELAVVLLARHCSFEIRYGDNVDLANSKSHLKKLVPDTDEYRSKKQETIQNGQIQLARLNQTIQYFECKMSNAELEPDASTKDFIYRLAKEEIIDAKSPDIEIYKFLKGVALSLDSAIKDMEESSSVASETEISPWIKGLNRLFSRPGKPEFLAITPGDDIGPEVEPEKIARDRILYGNCGSLSHIFCIQKGNNDTRIFIEVRAWVTERKYLPKDIKELLEQISDRILQAPAMSTLRAELMPTPWKRGTIPTFTGKVSKSSGAPVEFIETQDIEFGTDRRLLLAHLVDRFTARHFTRVSDLSLRNYMSSQYVAISWNDAIPEDAPIEERVTAICLLKDLTGNRKFFQLVLTVVDENYLSRNWTVYSSFELVKCMQPNPFKPKVLIARTAHPRAISSLIKYAGDGAISVLSTMRLIAAYKIIKGYEEFRSNLENVSSAHFDDFERQFAVVCPLSKTEFSNLFEAAKTAFGTLYPDRALPPLAESYLKGTNRGRIPKRELATLELLIVEFKKAYLRKIATTRDLDLLDALFRHNLRHILMPLKPAHLKTKRILCSDNSVKKSAFVLSALHAVVSDPESVVEDLTQPGHALYDLLMNRVFMPESVNHVLFAKEGHLLMSGEKLRLGQPPLTKEKAAEQDLLGFVAPGIFRPADSTWIYLSNQQHHDGDLNSLMRMGLNPKKREVFIMPRIIKPSNYGTRIKETLSRGSAPSLTLTIEIKEEEPGKRKSQSFEHTV